MLEFGMVGLTPALEGSILSYGVILNGGYISIACETGVAESYPTLGIRLV
jgi:hypothetical protein